MNSKSNQEIEFAVSHAMAKFLKEQMGEEPEEVIAEFAGSSIIVRFKGILPPAEKNMARNQDGLKLIKELKEKLIERAKPVLKIMIKNIVNAEVIDIHSSFDPATGERIEIFILNEDFKKEIPCLNGQKNYRGRKRADKCSLKF